MDIRIETNVLKKHKLFLAAPCYGGNATGIFAKSLADLSGICAHYGMALQIYLLFNESLIPRARNYCVDEFMRGDATHFMFIDSDIGFSAQDVIALLTLQIQNPHYHIIGAPYPKKNISWEKVKQAVDKGMADKNPNDLEKYIGDFVFNPVGGKNVIPLGEPAEVLELGTGFMMVRRETFQKFAEAFPQYAYRPDHARSAHFDGSRKIIQYFQAEIDPKTERYLSEDYWFTQKCREIGLTTWMCPWMKLAHMGSYIYSGSLVDLAQIGAAATVDPSKVKKK